MSDDISVEKVGLRQVQVKWAYWHNGRKAHHVATDTYAQTSTRDAAYEMTVKNPPGCPNFCTPWSWRIK